MNDEEQRLLTFTNWPTDSPIPPAKLAKAGFYYTGVDYKVKCFACDIVLTYSYPEEDVQRKHRWVSPACPFLLDPFTSENIPIFRTGKSFGEDSSKKLQDYKARMETFKNWPYGKIVKAEKLAAAGFYALGHGDKVKCAFCFGMAAYWEPGDDPILEHKRHFPKCKFVLANFNIKNLNVHPKEHHTQTSYSGYTPVNNTVATPKSPEYDTKENRLATFTNWPWDKNQRPPALADAGFFYLGVGDKVRCFFCGGTLKNWQPEDDVWVEHARWFPTCDFVKFIKGEDFIEHCLEDNDADSDETTYRSASPQRSNINVIRSLEVANVNLNETSSRSTDAANEPTTLGRRENVFKTRTPTFNREEKKK